MNRRIIIALLALTTALAVPVAAQAQYNSDWRSPTFPWLKRFKPANAPANQAALNGDAAIRYQETINAYAHK